LFVYDFETDIITQLTDTVSEEEKPVWNPLNSEIAFSSSRASKSSNVSDIYILNLQNMAVQRLTNTDNSGRQLWFANGNELLFWSNNELFKYDFGFGLATKLPVNLSSNIGFRPLSLSLENEYVLLKTFNLVDSHKEHKLKILDIRNGDIHEGISISRFNGAD